MSQMIVGMPLAALGDFQLISSAPGVPFSAAALEASGVSFKQTPTIGQSPAPSGVEDLVMGNNNKATPPKFG